MRVLPLSLALLLGACALTPESTPLPALAKVPEAFEMSGRIAVRNGQQNEIAKLRWTHARDSDRWVVSSPIGNEVARISADGEGALLEQAGAPAQRAPSFAALTRQLLGVAIEPRELAEWLHGQAPRDAAGWTVTLDERQAAGDVEIARRMTATRGPVTVRLVVDDYRPLAE